MGSYAIRVNRSDGLIRIETEHDDLITFGQDLLRQRFIIGDLVEENGQEVIPVVRVLVPAHRIELVAECSAA